MKESNIGCIAIVHDILTTISDHEIHEALGEEFQFEQIMVIRFEIRLELGDTMGFGWQARKTKQFHYFRDKVEPELNNHPEAVITYFGLAPIPLAVHLGYMISGLKAVRVFQKHHDKKHWKWMKKNTSVDIITSNVPRDYFKGKGDVVLTCSGTYPVHRETLEGIVNEPIIEPSIEVEKPERDVFLSEQSLKDYASEFRGVMDQIANSLPGIDLIHLFAGIPTGLAFLMGQEIQKNIHPDIALYEYNRESLPCYQQVFVLQSEPYIERIVPEEEKNWISSFRDMLEAHLNEHVKSFVETIEDKKEDCWIDGLQLNKSSKELFYTSYWKNLAPINSTRLVKSNFSNKAFDDTESQFFVSDQWFISDALIHTLHKRIPNEKDLMAAFRLFWFHEVIHDKSHGLNSVNTSGIGRYPKILEEADYQADVYALLHEFEFITVRKRDVLEFFKQKVELAINTMWAFDDLNPSSRMQVRRIGRYLIWYFQLLCVSEYCVSLEDVLSILSEKPLIELRLVGVTSPDNERLELDLEGFKNEQLGIAVFYKNRFYSFGFGNGQLSLDKLMVGFRERKHELIVEVMRQLVHILIPIAR